VLDPGRHRLEACRLDPADHHLRDRGGGDVDIAERLSQQGVAHRAADHARFLALAVANAALVLMIGSFVVLAQFGGAPPGSTYTPAHVKDGVLVPGQTK